MTRCVDFYFDYSCPFAYIASTRIEALAGRARTPLRLMPVLLGGILRELNGATNLFETMSPSKARHNVLDMHRWAAVQDVPFHFHPGHPVRTVTALRVTLAAGEPYGPLMHAFFKAYWVDGRDLADPAVVAAILRDRGLDAEATLARATSSEIKAELRARTDAAIAAGLFGVPSMVVGDVLYWGQDRLVAVADAVSDYEDTTLMNSLLRADGDRTVDLWFDYSSPFSYIAATRAPGMFGDALRWRPMLLGAVFKSLGGPMVPLFAMNESKRAYIRDDLQRQAAEARAELRWPSGFPLNTVTALRVTLAVAASDQPDRLAAVIAGFFRAVWVEDRDPQDPDVVRAVCAAAGLDGDALLLQAGSPAGKQALRDATGAAVELGVFGAPTWAVHAKGRAPGLFWGNDRSELALRAACGDDRVLDAGLDA